MKAYRICVHNNFGASSFTNKLINKIYNALKDKGIIGTILSEDYDIAWQGEPGEELDFNTAGFRQWQCENLHADMQKISKKFPKCSFCLLSVSDCLDDTIAEYYHDGAYQICEFLEDSQSNLW